MRSVKIKTQELLEVLRKNRETHQADFDKAIVGYREAVVKEIKTALRRAEEGKDVNTLVSAVKPSNYVKSYDTVIRMLEMSSEDTVELTMQEFNQYVQDEWHWKQEFAATSMLYNKR